MTIACLGWGSLIWDPRNLPICSEWRTDGPELPIEFARQSQDGRITLVIVGGARPVPVLWAMLDVPSIGDARRSLAEREGISADNAKHSIGAWTADIRSSHGEIETIANWAKVAPVTGVVWTALKPRFGGRLIKPAGSQVVRYLLGLEPDKRRRAEEYIRRAPAQIKTAYRERIERELGWTVLQRN